MYYKALIFIVAGIFAVVAVGCGAQQQQGGQKKQNAQTGQASQSKQKTTQKPASEATTVQHKGAGAKGKAGQKAAGKAGAKPGGKARGKAGKAHPVWGVVGAVNIQKSKIYFRPRGKKAIPLKYFPKQVRITMDGRKAQPQDIERGQRARVIYTTRKVKKKNAKRNQRYILHSMKLIPAGNKQKEKPKG